MYNLACAENLAGNTEAALAALDYAVKAGFEDFHRAQDDPDLQSLAGEPGFQALILEHDWAMAELSVAKGFSINQGAWSPDQDLLSWAPKHAGIDSSMQMGVIMNFMRKEPLALLPPTIQI